MPDTKNEKAKGKPTISALRLRRETLRELQAGELQQAQGGKGPGSTHFCTRWCDSYAHCTRGCG